jgi:hypothetical protein
LTAVELIFLILFLIFYSVVLREKLSSTKNKKVLRKSLTLISIFLGVSICSTFLIDPFYYINPINQLILLKNEIPAYVQMLHPPSLESNTFSHFFYTISVTLIPLTNDGYPDYGNNEGRSIYNYTSIPLIVFFMVGIVCLFSKIKNNNLSLQECALLIWYFSFFILISLTIVVPSVDRFFMPLIIPMSLISSYGLWIFMKNIRNIQTKIAFFIFFISSHIITVLIFWAKFYFEPNLIWTNPIPINFQKAIRDPFVLVLGVAFVILFIELSILTSKKTIRNQK